MANVQRYVEGKLNVVLITTPSAVTVEVGDLMFLNNSDNLQSDGSSTVDNYAYPISYLRISGGSLELNKREVKDRFIGVSMDYKPGIGNSSWDKKMSVATSGKFKFDLKPVKTVYPGSRVGLSGTSSGSNMLNQRVMKTSDTLITIGTFTEQKMHASAAELEIRSFLDPRGLL